MTKRNGRSGMVFLALAALAGLIFVGCEGGPTTPEVPAEPGMKWRLLEEGGGFTSPHGHTGQYLNDVASDGEQFVGVGGDGTIMLSADGDSWTSATASATQDWLHDVVWNGTRFFAVGERGTIVHSSDGSTWERVGDTGTGSVFLGIAWSGSRFVAVGGNGTIIASP